MLFRAFYALPKSIKGPDGNPVNALLGTANLILREVEAHDPRAVVLCFGPDAATYRLELFPAYHADREAAFPDELRPQWEDSADFFGASAGRSPPATHSRRMTCSERSRSRNARPAAAAC
jgi:5'-3' exonuclease